MEKPSKRGKIPQSDWPLIMARYEAGETLASIARTYDCSPRSEEHTSELQSRLHLVCRLLLEKKKKKPLRTLHKTKTEQRKACTRFESTCNTTQDTLAISEGVAAHSGTRYMVSSADCCYGVT